MAWDFDEARKRAPRPKLGWLTDEQVEAAGARARAAYARGERISDDKREREPDQRRTGRPIAQVDLATGLQLWYWRSLISAVRATGADYHQIRACALGERESADGFGWTWDIEEDTPLVPAEEDEVAPSSEQVTR